MASEGDHRPDLSGSVRPAPNGAGWAWPMGVRVLVAAMLAMAGTSLRLADGGRHGFDEVRDREPPTLRVDINHAPPGVLEALPHVGPSLCGRIIEERRIRPFSSAEDLRRRVKGIGPATLARLRPYLSFTERGAHDADPAPVDGPRSAAPVTIARASARTARRSP
ncbi:ComEA family DNA-binding protein [Aquisphaera insulae]|uniref:ComEA family DNA-binding protein n=1 Tax=Aquisphaera insulae TaxID=2712864 RepID=UPI00196B4C63|nr:DUF655 domain-containing protein [Aquisphaera insulae]